MRSLFELIPLAVSNFFYTLLVNIYEPVVRSSIYPHLWLLLTLAQFGMTAMGQSLTLLLDHGGRNFPRTVIILTGTYVFSMVIGGVYVPLSQMHLAYRLLSAFSIPRFAYHLPTLLQYAFGRCREGELSAWLYMMDHSEADYLPSWAMLTLTVLLYRLLLLYLLAARLNVSNSAASARKKRIARSVVQDQTENDERRSVGISCKNFIL